MNADSEPDYALLARQLDALLADETDLLANTSNFVGLLWNALPRINWLGVYVARGDELVLGPFQGKPACTRIPIGQGVCGTAAGERQPQRVDDVHAFEGHIACDPDSRSELVIPLERDGEVWGVLDVDSPLTARFSKADEAGLARVCAVFLSRIAAGKDRKL